VSINHHAVRPPELVLLVALIVFNGLIANRGQNLCCTVVY